MTNWGPRWWDMLRITIRTPSYLGLRRSARRGHLSSRHGQGGARGLGLKTDGNVPGSNRHRSGYATVNSGNPETARF